MSDTSSPYAIRAHDVSKVYPEKLSSFSIRKEGMAVVRGWLNRHTEEDTTTEQGPRGFTALQGISFDVEPGSSIAFVGRNGSGKTTLIRLLANIMRPTTGSIEVNGRYSALIGLGTGFIRDMTGRENIYLNAAIYGVPPHETEEIIDEIIAFADIGAFIDRPVDEYSSGMNARLGFSVAVHILPDIVMIDEALAVGDTAFKRKCNEKLDALLSENRTLVLVSHSDRDVLRLCDRAIWLHQGNMMLDGEVKHVLREYNQFMNPKTAAKPRPAKKQKPQPG
ncbi:MAG: ABC transporter ATP-binding protein [Chloroflexota bacterium]